MQRHGPFVTTTVVVLKVRNLKSFVTAKTLNTKLTHRQRPGKMNICTIKSLARVNLEDGLTFEESVKLDIKTIRQTLHSILDMTPFRMQLGHKPRTAITYLIGQPACQAVQKTYHTITTAEGEIIQKKLASNSLNFQSSKGSEEPR